MQLLQNGKQQFIDSGGQPLANGTVGFYSVGTLSPLPTYQDQAGTILNPNPVTLDSRGQAIIWGAGTYRQIVKDASGVTIWDQISTDGGASVATPAADLANQTNPAKGAALVGFDNGTLASFFLSKNNRVVDGIATLRTLSKTTYTRAFATGYYAAGDGGGGPYRLDPADTTSADNGGTVIVAADGGRWKLQYFGSVSACQFGVIGDGVRDNTTQVAALQAWAATKSAAGNAVKITWPAGRYIYTASPNWAITNLCMEAIGEVWLINNGTGVSFLCDGGATGPGVNNVKITGNFFVYPSATSQQGVFIRAAHHSYIDIDSRGAGTGYQAIYLSWCVVTEFRLRASSNEGGWYNTPTHGLYLTQRGAGEQVSYCTFINPILEGGAIGAFLDGALGNTFIGGTMEACSNIGLQLTANAIQNKFISIDFEGNTNYDVFCQGSDNEFVSCDTLTKLSIAAGNDNHVLGGLHQLVETLGPANRTLLADFKYNRTSGSAYPADAGTKTRYRDLTNSGTGLQHNAPPSVTTLTVGASPYNYTNNSGNDQSVSIAPGTLTGVSLVRNGSFFPLPTTSGLYGLSPGDAIQVAYTVAPAMYVLPR
jgi:hypothetical protein